MNHFEAVEWNEGVKQMASDYLEPTMQKHRLAHGKGDVGTAKLWQRLVNAGAAEPGYQPAADTVRVAKAAFPALGRGDKGAKRRATGAQIRLLFDSFSHPGPVGTRSAATRTRQLLYRADPYQIDLQIELQPESDRIVVTGQLVDLGHPEMVGRDVPVILSDGREFMVNTVTNQFGEFRCEIRNSGDLELSFLGRSEKPIIILLPGVLDHSNGAGE